MTLIAALLPAGADGADYPTPDYKTPVTSSGCESQRCVKSMRARRIKRQRAHKLRVVAPYNAWLNRVAACESGGNWSTNTGNGFFGGLQFTLQSWAGVGGRGYPHLATVLEQKYRGVRLLHTQGPGAWPVCSHR